MRLTTVATSPPFGGEVRKRRQYPGDPSDAERRIIERYEAAIAQLRAGMAQAVFAQALASRDAVRAMAAIDLSGLEATMRTLEDEFGTVMQTAGNAAIESAGLQLRFDATSPHAIGYARGRAGELIVAIASEQREVIRDILTRSFVRGDSVDLTARMIRGVVGLHPRWAQAVYRFAESGASDRAVRAYAQRLLRRRALTIARTEIMSASNYATVAGWDQLRDQGLLNPTRVRVKWLTGPSPENKICAPMRGRMREYDAPFLLPNGRTLMYPPAHPGCRCSIGLVAGQGAIARERMRQTGYNVSGAQEMPYEQHRDYLDNAAQPVLAAADHIQSSVGAYTSELFEHMNGHLRGFGYVDEYADELALVKRHIAGLDDAFRDATHKLESELTVFRGIADNLGPQLRPGAVFHDKGFISTSLWKGKALQFSGQERYVMEIVMPKGQTVVAPGRLSSYLNEREIILNRGSRFRVLSEPRKVEFTSPETGVRMEAKMIKVELIPDVVPARVPAPRTTPAATGSSWFQQLPKPLQVKLQGMDVPDSAVQAAITAAGFQTGTTRYNTIVRVLRANGVNVPKKGAGLKKPKTIRLTNGLQNIVQGFPATMQDKVTDAIRAKLAAGKAADVLDKRITTILDSVPYTPGTKDWIMWVTNQLSGVLW